MVMKSVCEIVTPYSCIAVIRFDDENREEVKDLERSLAEWADDGLVSSVSFHPDH